MSHPALIARVGRQLHPRDRTTLFHLAVHDEWHAESAGTTYVPAALRRLVHERAGGACEYCLAPEATALFGHEVDHVVAEKHGGSTSEDNLALACAACNLHKGSDIGSIDPVTGDLVPLFHPRRGRWTEAFQLDGANIVGRTASARATVRLLQINHPDRVAERALLVTARLLRPSG